MNKDGGARYFRGDGVEEDPPNKQPWPAPVEADKELTKPLNKYVVSIVGDKVTFTDDIWAAIEALVDKAVVAELKDILYDLPLDVHVRRWVKARLSQLGAKDESA